MKLDLNIYAPTDSTIVEIKDAIEYQLNELLDSISRRKELILLGDFNARIEKNDK